MTLELGIRFVSHSFYGAETMSSAASGVAIVIFSR